MQCPDCEGEGFDHRDPTGMRLCARCLGTGVILPCPSADTLEKAPARDYAEDAELVPVGNGMMMEQRVIGEWPDVETIFWTENMEVISVIPGPMTLSQGEQFACGYMLGLKRGKVMGRHIGFRECQAGFRALLGTSSPQDVETFLQAATPAKGFEP